MKPKYHVSWRYRKDRYERIVLTALRLGTSTLSEQKNGETWPDISIFCSPVGPVGFQVHLGNLRTQHQIYSWLD